MPNLRELVESTGAKIDDWFYNQSNPQYAANQQLLADATAALYGNVGANLDNRNWDEIMASDNTIQAANDALAAMYSDPAYREENTANLVKAGYAPAQAYYTYGQMNDRVGANYTPSASEVAAVENYFKDLGQPDYKWFVTPGTGITSSSGSNAGGGTTSGSNAGTATGSQNNTTGQLTAGSQAMDTFGGGASGSNWNARQAVGAADGSLMGAGNANYNSSLIKSLRQSSLTPYSTNTGVLMAPNQGASTSSAAAPSMDQMGGAFNPQVLNPRAASDQEVADWNAYSTYRTNALNAKTPILSMSEWLAAGKSDGKAPAAPDAPVYAGGVL